MPKGFKELVYKSKHGDIPFRVRDYVPKGKIWVDSKEDLTEIDIKTGKTKKLKAKDLRFII